MEKDWKSRLASFDNWKREGMNALYVATGLVGATIVDRLIQKGIEKWVPSLAPHAALIKPGAIALGGLVLSVMQDNKSPNDDRLRLFGYGLTSAGVLSGIRNIPFVDQLLSGTESVNGLNGLKGAENLLNLNLGEFGKSDNIKKATTIEAEVIDVNLPDLGNTNANRTAYSNPSNDTETIDVELEELTAEFI